MKSSLITLATIVLGTATLTHGQQSSTPWQHDDGAAPQQAVYALPEQVKLPL